MESSRNGREEEEREEEESEGDIYRRCWVFVYCASELGFVDQLDRRGCAVLLSWLRLRS